MLKHVGSVVFALGLVVSAAAARAATIVDVSTGPVFSVGFSVATDPFVQQSTGGGQPPSYAASLAPQTALIGVPQFDHSLGRLNATQLTLDLLSIDSTGHETYYADPAAEIYMYGSHTVGGAMTLFANGVNIGGVTIGVDIFPAACVGFGTVSCTHTGGFSA